MITADAQQLEPGGRVTVYELDASSVGADQLYFHQHLQTGVIWWQGQQYGAWPIEATGFARTSDQQPAPRLRVGNGDGRIGAMCRIYDDLVGARIIRRQTLVKYLDVENFPPLRNLVANSNRPALAPWFTQNATVSAGPAQSVDGITFAAPAVVASTGAQFNRRNTNLRGSPRMSAGQTLTVTAYFAYGTSNAGRVHFTNQTASGAKDSNVQFSKGSMSAVPSTGGAGTLRVLEFSDLGNGVCKIVVSITFTDAGTGTPSIGVGPNSATTGTNIKLLGMQVEDGSSGSPFQVTTTNPDQDRHPTADPNEHFPDEIWFIERKVAETKEMVEFELATAIDLNGEVLPGRQIMSNVCTWLLRGGYRGPYCSYTGSAYFDINDNPVDDPGQDVCAGLVRSCKRRFGENNELPYGGFPAAGLVRT